MSILQDCGYVDVEKFESPNLLVDSQDVTQPQAVSCRNVEYLEGQVNIPRRGFTRAWNPSTVVRIMYNWIQQQYNRLIYLDSTDRVWQRNLVANTEFAIRDVVTAAGVTFVQAGYRLYMAFFAANSTGSLQTMVWDGTDLEFVFHPPLTMDLAGGAPSADIKASASGSFIWANVTNLGAGAVTHGDHAIVLIATTRAGGYQTSPGPIDPTSSTNPILADPIFQGSIPNGNYHISVSVSPQNTWPRWISQIQIAMTTAIPIPTYTSLSLLRYFLVPGQIVTPTPGTATPVVFDLNIDDVTLSGGAATEITNTLFGLYHAAPILQFYSVGTSTLTSIVVAANVGTINFPLAVTNQLTTGQIIVVSGSTTGALNAAYIINFFGTSGQLIITTSGVANGTYNNGALRVDLISIAGTQPHCVIAYNNRTVYLTRTTGSDGVSLVGTIIISEPNKPQYATANQHFIYLPEQRDVITGFALGGTLFICGPSWTYAFSDNLRVPVFWAPSRLVSESIGSPFIRGVSVNQSKGYAWIADHTGLYQFSGANYPVVPASYKQTPDWDRINFGASQAALRVLDSPDDRIVIVRAPLDGATASTHLLVWDYTYGVTPDRIRYCGLWNLSDYPNIGDIEIVQAATSKIKQLWISSGTAGSNADVKRLKSIEAGDATAAYPDPLYSDDGASAVGIDGSYELVAVSRAPEGVQMQIGGRFRIRGAGQVEINAYSFDQQRTTALEPITQAENSLTPGQRFDRFLDEQSEVVSYAVSNGARANVFAWWIALRAYFIPWMTERGEDNQ